ncbi:MAG: MarR family transcriptional regulator, partial [Marmoricola sp.]|nr:MarR family transcriptional regulator [Marmoricola sp.]
TLRHLARHGATGVSDLARSDRVSTQAISLRVAPLVEAGLAARAPDPADGRRTVLSITAAGAEVVDRAHRTALETLGHALEALDQGDREALAGALPALEAIGAHLQAQATGSVA